MLILNSAEICGPQNAHFSRYLQHLNEFSKMTCVQTAHSDPTKSKSDGIVEFVSLYEFGFFFANFCLIVNSDILRTFGFRGVCMSSLFWGQLKQGAVL